MTTFFDLFAQHSSDPSVRDDPTWADRRFQELITSSPFHLWRPGDPLPKSDVRYLIGMATWSGYDMRLLDVIANALHEHSLAAPIIDLFNTADCRHPEDFAHYIPTLNEVAQTPVLGFWRDGQFASHLQGHKARKMIAELFGSTPEEIVAFVQDWIKGRAFAQ